MLSFKFKLNKTEQQLRQNIDYAMQYNTSRKWLCFTARSGGMNFFRNGKIISGNYIDNHESTGSHRGSPIRVNFRAAVKEKNGEKFLKGIIYPNPFEVAFLAGCYISSVYFGFESIFAMVFATFVFLGFVWGYIKLTKNCYAELSLMATGSVDN